MTAADFRAMRPSERTIAALALIPEGGDWRDLPPDIAEVCMGGAYHSSGGRTSYFRRLHRDRPAPTIVGSPNQKSTYLGHPTENRPINEREAALLQTFTTHPLNTAGGADLLGANIVALDLFAGAGGWSTAATRLGILDHGVEIMPEARATRDAAGFSTIFGDVWEGLKNADLLEPWAGDRRLLIASPPCQSFSIAGKGAGRRALDDVLALISDRAYELPGDGLRLRAEELGLDDRTALVLSPLAYIFKHRPDFVALEQVPTVLPVWQAYLDVLKTLGYSARTELLTSEMFGVPQTRKRAILVASLHHDAQLPVPTHSRYYPRDPQRMDPGVLPWVSMAEALGWGMTARPYMTIATGTESGGTDPAALGGSGARKTVYGERARGAWCPSGDTDNDGGVLRLNQHEASAIQSFPEPEIEAQALARPDDAAAPAHSIREEVDVWKWRDAPATTVAGDPRITAREHHFHGEQSKTSLKLTEDEAIALQTFPRVVDANEPGERLQQDGAQALQAFSRSFPFQGSKSKRFLQIGNAVPPLLAEAVLCALLHDPKLRIAQETETKEDRVKSVGQEIREAQASELGRMSAL